MPKHKSVFIVLYFPDPILIDRVRLFTKCGLTVFIYNNSCDPNILSQLSSLKGVVLLGGGMNHGLGKALNQGLSHVYSVGFHYCLVLDQDTHLTEDAINIIFNKNSLPVNSLLNYYSSHKINKLSHIFINSGCYFNLSLLSKLGYHSDKFFVEGVDYELGLRALRSGFIINRFNIIGFDHSSFQDNSSFYLFGRNFCFRAYPIKRSLNMLFAYFNLLVLSLAFRPFWGYSLFFIKNIISVILLNPLLLLLKFYAR